MFQMHLRNSTNILENMKCKIYSFLPSQKSNWVFPIVTMVILKQAVGFGFTFPFLPFSMHSTNAVFPLPSNPTTSIRRLGRFGSVCGIKKYRAYIEYLNIDFTLYLLQYKEIHTFKKNAFSGFSENCTVQIKHVIDPLPPPLAKQSRIIQLFKLFTSYVSFLTGYQELYHFGGKWKMTKFALIQQLRPHSHPQLKNNNYKALVNGFDSLESTVSIYHLSWLHIILKKRECSYYRQYKIYCMHVINSSLSYNIS